LINKIIELENKLKAKEIEIEGIRTENEKVKTDCSKLRKENINKREALKDKDEKISNLEKKVEEMTNGVIIIKEEKTAEELEDSFAFLRNMKIEINSIVELKNGLNEVNQKFNNYRIKWRDELELLKSFLVNLNPTSEHDYSAIVEKITRYLSILKKFKLSANLKQLWYQKDDELTKKIEEFKKILKNY
jgi:hypothetical protein